VKKQRPGFLGAAECDLSAGGAALQENLDKVCGIHWAGRAQPMALPLSTRQLEDKVGVGTV